MANQTESDGRRNQRHRTRKDLLAAAGRLLKAGRTPDMDDVAREAMVSRATAYRYFPHIEQLLVEAPIDDAVPTPETVFAGDRSTDPAERVDRAERALHEMVFRNEAQLRLMLAASMEHTAKPSGGANGTAGARVRGGMPVRQNRRTPLIEAALAPARDRFTDAAYERLRAALAVVFGTESMVVFRDVLAVDEPTARRVKGWAARALVEAALKESAGKVRARRTSRPATTK